MEQKKVMVLPLDATKVNEWVASRVQVPGKEAFVMYPQGMAIEPRTNWVIETDGCFSQTAYYWHEGRVQECYFLAYDLKEHYTTEDGMPGYKQSRGAAIMIGMDELRTLCDGREVDVVEFVGNRVVKPRIAKNLRDLLATFQNMEDEGAFDNR